MKKIVVCITLMLDYLIYFLKSRINAILKLSNKVEVMPHKEYLQIAVKPTGGLGDYIVSSKFMDELFTYAPCKIDVYCEKMEFGEAIFAKRKSGAAITRQEELQFKTAFMIFVGKQYHRLNWVMQLHYGCKRDNNTLRYAQLGPDTGYDCINNYAPSAELADFLNALIKTDELPKTIIYSLNPNDNQAIGTILGCFQDSTACAKIQQGSAWWFNDHKTGMQDQMISLANLGNLSGFVGMLTDSRSFLSYTRHEYFRRILCNLIGNWVEDGEFPNDMETLEEIVKGISYNNAINYFGFDLTTI